MNKLKINYFIDILLALSFVIVAITSILIFFRLSPKHTLSELHTISGMIFILLSLVHLGMHFNWFVCVTKNMFTKENKECKK